MPCMLQSRHSFCIFPDDEGSRARAGGENFQFARQDVAGQNLRKAAPAGAGKGEAIVSGGVRSFFLDHATGINAERGARAKWQE